MKPMAGEPKRKVSIVPKNPSLGDAVFISVVAVMAVHVCFWAGTCHIVYGASGSLLAFVLSFALSGYMTALAVMYTVRHIRTEKRRPKGCDDLRRVMEEVASLSVGGTSGTIIRNEVSYFVNPEDEESDICFVVESFWGADPTHLFTAEAFRKLIETVSDTELNHLVGLISRTRNLVMESNFTEPPWRDKGD